MMTAKNMVIMNMMLSMIIIFIKKTKRMKINSESLAIYFQNDARMKLRYISISLELYYHKISFKLLK